MNIRDLEYLVALADQRNFRRAAEICNVSQPTLSTQLRKLEDELGVALVERIPRNVILTAAGADVVARARRILAELAELRQSASARSGAQNRLRLGIFPTLSPYLLPHIIPPIRIRFPEMELLLTEEKSSVLRQQLASGQLDAAILADPSEDGQQESLHLFDEPFFLAVPSSHRLSRQDFVEPGDLRDEKLMLLEEGHCLRDQALEASRQVGAREETTFRATSLETLRQMVAAGVGMTFLPALACLPSALDSRGYSILPFQRTTFQRSVAIHWRRTSPMAEAIAACSQIIAAEIPALIDRAGPPRLQ